MRVAYAKIPNNIELREIPIPQPGANEVLVKILACGICGSDPWVAFSTAHDWETFGHEMSGVVEKCGENVTWVKVGDKVCVKPSTPCGICLNCELKRYIRCSNPIEVYGRLSGFADYICVHERTLVSCQGLDFKMATLVEPLSVGLNLLKLAEVEVYENVLLIGGGPIGLLTLAAMKYKEVNRIYVAEKSTCIARVRMAKELGVDRVIQVDQENMEEILRQESPEGIDKVLVTAPPKTIEQVINFINPGGIISYIGIADDSSITFDANTFHFKQLQLRTYITPPSLLLEAVDLLKKGVIDTEKFITHTFDLDHLQEAIQKVVEDKPHVIKVVITMEKV